MKKINNLTIKTSFRHRDVCITPRFSDQQSEILFTFTSEAGTGTSAGPLINHPSLQCRIIKNRPGKTQRNVFWRETNKMSSTDSTEQTSDEMFLKTQTHTERLFWDLQAFLMMEADGGWWRRMEADADAKRPRRSLQLALLYCHTQIFISGVCASFVSVNHGGLCVSCTSNLSARCFSAAALWGQIGGE